MSDEKKKTIILTCVLAVIALLLLGFFVIDKLTENGTIANSESKEIMSNFKKYYNSSKRTVIYYASETCGWCKLETPILETIAEDYDMDYVYIDTSKLGKKQIKEITEKLGIKSSTPTTVIVENGEVIDVAAGFKAAGEYVEFFATNGVIPEDAVYSKEQNLTFIDFEEYESLINDGNSHVIVLGQTTCSHCIAAKPALNSIAEDYGLTINYIDINVLEDDEYERFYESLSKIEYNDEDFINEGKFGTPLTLILKNGKVSSYIAGERSKSQFVREFKKEGLISE